MPKVKGLMYFLAAAAAGTSVANAQCTPTATTNGPDVIVGDIQAVTNYAVSGTLDAISLGTTSCNIGPSNLNWIQTTNQHPVVGQNLLKYKVSNYSGAGTNSYARFEQIGQSWLKHTFAAFAETACCTDCQTGGLNQFLRPHCSDPYTSQRNGSQSGLGPKWQVNAHTGAFPYPFANPGNPSATSVSRRMEYLLSDAEASNGSTVRYFGECQYVTLDDATQGNQDNNTSHREVSMTTTGTFPNATASNVLMLGTVNRARLGIQAWKVLDPTVTETERLITETSGGPTGRVMICSKATDLGNGYWHYEYAIENQNSDVSIGKLTIPLPAAALVQNIGFHDVTYRDGDGIGNLDIDGTDWPATRLGDTISWAATSFASNNNGNGLRWGTLYNFRFDANVAPNLTGSATLSSWKVIADFAAAAQVPGALTAACYANCDGSTTLPCMNVLDFSCFLNRFAANDSYANCDASTTVPVLNVLDFSCFLNAFAAGCSNC